MSHEKNSIHCGGGSLKEHQWSFSFSFVTLPLDFRGKNLGGGILILPAVPLFVGELEREEETHKDLSRKKWTCG